MLRRLVPRSRALKPLVILPAVLVLALALAGVASAQTATTAGTTVTTAGNSVETTPGASDAASGPVVTRPAEVEPLNPGLVFESIDVQVWPEFDQPSVLVMVDLVLPQQAVFPVKFKWAAPKGAQITGVAEVRSDGSFDYSRPAPQFHTSQPDRDIISVEIPKLRNIRLEYYYNPNLNLTGQRTFPMAFELPGDARQASLSVQEPSRSSGFAVTPPLGSSSSDQQGMRYVGQTFTDLKGGDGFQVQIGYSKADANPSQEPGSAGTPGAATSGSYLLILLGILVVGVGGFAVYRLWLRPRPATYSRGGRPPTRSGAAVRARTGKTAAGRGRAAVDARPGKGARPAAAGRNPGSSGTPRFCTNCGAELGKRERFCPLCGTAREA